MASFTSQISFVLLFSLFATTFNSGLCSTNRVVRCNENDQRLLLIFKQGVVDPSNSLSSWTVEEDCCSWVGVHCDNITSRVTELFLTNHTLQGEINLCLLQLEFLTYLDLSHNQIATVSMPPCHVSKSPRDGHKFDNQSLVTPSNQSANFSVALHYLNFSHNYDLRLNDLHWLSQFSSLKYLDLSHCDIGTETKWLQHMAILPSLSVLILRDCELGDFPSLNFVNFTSLVTLDLSVNLLISELPNSFFNFTNNISVIDLSYNYFYGQLPIALFKLPNLKYLSLKSNHLKGSVPDWLGQHENLKYLDIPYNLFSGSVPPSPGNLSSLTSLFLSYNHLSGYLP